MPCWHKVWEMQIFNTSQNNSPQCRFGRKSVILGVCLEQSYNQFDYDGSSRYIKFILKETGFWNQLPRCIRQVRASANQRVYWQTQHWFLNVYNLPDSSIPDLIWWISMGRPAALVISTTKLASFVTWWQCATSAASVQTYWSSMYTTNLIRDQILNPIS